MSEQAGGARLPALTPDTMTADQLALYSGIAEGPRAQGPQYFALRNEDGSLRGPFNAFLYSPALGNAIQNLGAAVRYSTDLDGRTRELAILIVAAHWHSGFERESHEGVGTAAGLSRHELDELWAGRLPNLADPRERAAAELTFAMTRGDVSDADWDRLVSVLGPSTAFELSTLVGYYAAIALQLRVFRVDAAPEEQ